jgi:hypothetical protein
LPVLRLLVEVVHRFLKVQEGLYCCLLVYHVVHLALRHHHVGRRRI